MRLGEQSAHMGKYQVLQAAKRKFFSRRENFYSIVPNFPKSDSKYVASLMYVNANFFNVPVYHSYYVEIYYERSTSKFVKLYYEGTYCSLENT